MKPLVSLIVLAAVCFTTSCGSKEGSEARKKTEPAVGYSISEGDWKDSDFTEWMSRAELQYLQEMSPPEQYFAYVEGRNNKGLAEYRAVKRDLPTDQYSQWAVFWGIEESELFDWELRLLKTGFERKSMQIFFNSNGTPVHQIVWLRPVGAIDNVPDEAMHLGENPPEPVLPEPGEEEPSIVLVAPQSEIDPIPEIVVDPVEEAPKADKIYVVAPGDNLGKIANRFKTTVSALKTKNNLKNDILRIGQKLKVP